MIAWNFNKESSAGCDRCLIGYFAPKTLNDILNDGQSKAHTAGFGGEIGFEEVFLGIFTDARSIVSNTNQGKRFIFLNRDVDLARLFSGH